MREALAPREELRGGFSGTFVRLGTKHGWQGRTEPTVLLQNIRDAQGTRVADHLWFNLTKALAALHLVPGETVCFEARVKRYSKGYHGRREDAWTPVAVDYKLSHPTKVRRATDHTTEKPRPLFGSMEATP